MAAKARAVQCIEVLDEHLDSRAHATFRGMKADSLNRVRLACGGAVYALGGIYSTKRRPTCPECRAAVRRRR